jgi:hypothetical protein
MYSKNSISEKKITAVLRKFRQNRWSEVSKGSNDVSSRITSGSYYCLVANNKIWQNNSPRFTLSFHEWRDADQSQRRNSDVAKLTIPF